MSTDKTLADVQPGGRVRLGDQAERARFEAWAEGASLNIARFNDGGYCDERTVSAWLAWLSAKPSPGGQDALTAQQIYDRFGFLEGLVTEATYRRIAEEATRIQQQALAARQPVGEPVAWRNHGAAIDAKALAAATEISLMWGQDRSQFVRRIQVAVIEAMRWMDGTALAAKPSPGGQGYSNGRIDIGSDVVIGGRKAKVIGLDPYTPCLEIEWADAQGSKEYRPREQMILAARQPVGEPIGWYTEDHLTDRSATTYDRTVAERWRAKGWPVSPLYAAPPA